MARAAFYAFLVSEVHPFEDGNGRLSRLVMNAELSRVGLTRIIIPTLLHPHYVDCVRVLTRQNEASGLVRCLAKMARWANQFDYSSLDELIAALRKTNALSKNRQPNTACSTWTEQASCRSEAMEHARLRTPHAS
jgi:Fic family protein